MIWITKTYAYGEGHTADQNTFRDVQLKVAAWGTRNYERMMMVLANEDESQGVSDKERTLILLPDVCAPILRDYVRFDGVLPRVATLIVGSQSECAKYFDAPKEV